MNPIVKNEEIRPGAFAMCHGGEGTLFCKSLLDTYEGEKTDFGFMHADDIPAGVSIGVHAHTVREEIYYLVSGSGILTYDGVEYDMQPGDVSLCGKGHSHGYKALTDSVLIVVG